VVDRDRILAKLDEMDGYLRELESVVPPTLDAYRTVEKRRSCERLLHMSVESVLDVCHLLVSGKRLGLPGAEEDVLDKLEAARVFSAPMVATLRRMKGCRNILVHEYGNVLDEIIFEAVSSKRGDFADFRREVLQALQSG
jgi:uncharacterized protein YutE (UPF0331/DUF86 family)